MNKRKAGEDFYFLQKIAKNGKIKPVYSTRVFPSSRKSDRVPFGTGQRVDRFFKKTHDEYLLYDPEIFNILKKWNSFFLNPVTHKTDDFKNTANSLGSSFNDYLQKINFFDSWEKVLHSSTSKEQVQKQKLFLFDGFKTLKMIHHLRDTRFPMINMFEALDTFFKLADIKSEIDRTENIPDLEDQLEYNFLLKNYLKREPIYYL